MGLMLLLSCSDKEDPNGAKQNLTSVDGTTWTTVYMHEYAELSFRNGKFTVTGAIEGYGTYMQDGDKISFNNTRVLMPFPRRMINATINNSGLNMEIVFDNDGLNYDQKYVVVKFLYDMTR